MVSHTHLTTACQPLDGGPDTVMEPLLLRPERQTETRTFPGAPDFMAWWQTPASVPVLPATSAASG